jgi:para-aminobenzoate synthetase / 4-amino-4-deoxychorismate lyase
MNRWYSPPAELYALVDHEPATILLECEKTVPTNPLAQVNPQEFCSRVFTRPLRVCVVNEPAEIPSLFVEIERAVAAGQYAAGFFAYECGACFEPKTGLRPSRSGDPLAWIGIYDRCYLFDHRTGAFLDGDPPGLSKICIPVDDHNPPPGPQLTCALALTERQYAERITAIHELIRAGDAYQINFTVPLRIHAQSSPAALYRQLRASQPTPYGAFLHTQPNRRILSFSPELFFRLENHGESRRILTRPMKGTAPRGRTTQEDRVQSDWLRNDAKNRSENVMIVDLLRNDLGRLCHYGTVRTESLFAVERYPTLWQMTSTVTGELRSEVDFSRIFRALFPCGSITGAPKVRAMQLLAHLEDEPRGVYTGAIGFFSKEQTVFNVAIRTLDLEGQGGEHHGIQGTMGIGSGIVIDSDPAAEFRECLLKAEFLTRAQDALPGGFSLVETLLWHNGYPLIELHLDRLEDSAAYFAFLCDRAAIRAALQAKANTFAQALGAPGLVSETWESTDLPASKSPRKVRLLLDHDGAFHITSEPISPNPTPARVGIASQRTDPRDPMLFHKTTHRPLYAEVLKAATQAGYDDALFLNLHGEVTEGAIHNIFIEKDGQLFTPPIESGLLPGIHRRHLLETQPNVEERPISLDDLRHADAIYLSNAVRGLRPAIVDWEAETAPGSFLFPIP